MTKTVTKVTVTIALAVAACLAVTAGPAAAHGGPRLGGASTTKLVNAGAKELGVTSATLKAAIVKSANARIDAAVEDEDLTSTQAADLKDEVADNLNTAYALSRASTVASNLGIAVTKLNDGFRAARKALITARIDAALADGDIDADQAAELKSELDDADLPGYKQSSLGSAFGGPGGGRGHGHGGGDLGGLGGFGFRR